MRPGEIIVDNFAGGGGASTGIEQALGWPIDIAINHSPRALAMHAANHPETRHYCEDVFAVDPREVAAGRPVGLAWFSPDCTHFSRAKGSTPVKKTIRGLAWIVLKWAGLVRPRVIILENVPEFRDWGPVRKGRPVKSKKGLTFERFVGQLQDLGYQVEWRDLAAHHFGAPTIRKRLFMVARCDGQPIVWPEPTHCAPGDLETKMRGLAPYRTAADIIDWSIPCPSIFERKKPLATKTMARIARGIERFVINHPDPFIINISDWSASGQRRPVGEPLSTVTANPKGGKHALVMPAMVQTGYGERPGQAPRALDIEKPLGTVVAGGQKHALVAAFLAKHFGGMTGVGIGTPLPTMTARGTQTQLVAPFLTKFKGTCRHGLHTGEVRAFLMKYYGTSHEADVRSSLGTVTTKDRFGLVTIAGFEYQIVDIGMRMLSPRELFAAQGFPADTIIDAEFEGKPLTKTTQVLHCGNSVSPYPARALVAAQFPETAVKEQVA